MNINKLSSEEVPGKFSEWLLSMGCPPEKVPGVDLIAQMCRGQYYMVWRSLIENVAPKDGVKYKRLLVFSDDVQNYRDKKEKCDIIPDEIALWTQHEDLKQKVLSAEEQIKDTRTNIQHLMDKISNKLSQRHLALNKMNDAKRRLYLLQQVSDDLQNKKSNLLETMSIAKSLCFIEKENDAQNKLDKCLTLLRLGNGRGPSTSSTNHLSNWNSTCSSTMSTYSDYDAEEQMLSLVKCGGDNLWPLLCERRAELINAFTRNNVWKEVRNDRWNPQTVLSNTCALHCTIALEGMKNKVHIEKTRKRLAKAIANLNMYPADETCEYLVVCCERIRAEARVNALKTLLDELGHRKGVFEADGRHVAERHAARRMISNIDKAIVNKKEDLKRSLSSLGMTERKIENLKECLKIIFQGFQDQRKLKEIHRYGDQISLPQESMSTLRQFYEEKREKMRTKVNLSLDLDISINSDTNIPGDGSPRFVDELKLYLDRFSLEKNRKLVLESGEKIWIFESLQSSLEKLYAKWQNENINCSAICPSLNICMNIQNIINCVHAKAELRLILNDMEGRMGKNNLNIDITKISTEEQQAADKIKKRINEDLLSLKEVSRTLDVGFKNLDFWSKNELAKYISTNRCVDGKTYKDYEKYYLELII